MRITNYGAACAKIETEGISILTDPWFTDGIYLGAWEREHYIPDPLTVIGPCDYVWISHLHEDHFDPVFLRKYLTAYPDARLWIGDNPSSYLLKTMEKEGFTPLVSNGLGTLMVLGWDAHIVPNHGYAAVNIDSALVVRTGAEAVVNMNDCPYDQCQVDAIRSLTSGLSVTALLPYSGAGPWPQCYSMEPGKQIFEAQQKKRLFLAQFQQYKKALRAEVAIPFSAGYMLRGPLANMNPFRGIPEQDEVEGATVLPVTGVAKRPGVGYAWENDPLPHDEILQLRFEQAEAKAPKVSGPPLKIVFEFSKHDQWVLFATEESPSIPAHETIRMDKRLFHGLLTRKYHWNTCEIASVLNITRHGERYDSRVFDYLCRFHV